MESKKNILYTWYDKYIIPETKQVVSLYGVTPLMSVTPDFYIPILYVNPLQLISKEGPNAADYSGQQDKIDFINDYRAYKLQAKTKLNVKFMQNLFTCLAKDTYRLNEECFVNKEIKVEADLSNLQFQFDPDEPSLELETLNMPLVQDSIIRINNVPYLKNIVVGKNNSIKLTVCPFNHDKVMDNVHIPKIITKDDNTEFEIDTAYSIANIGRGQRFEFKDNIDFEGRYFSLTWDLGGSVIPKDMNIKTKEGIMIKLPHYEPIFSAINLETMGKVLVYQLKTMKRVKGSEVTLRMFSSDSEVNFQIEELETSSIVTAFPGSRTTSTSLDIKKLILNEDTVSFVLEPARRAPNFSIYIREIVSPHKQINLDIPTNKGKVKIFYKDKQVKGTVIYV